MACRCHKAGVTLAINIFNRINYYGNLKRAASSLVWWISCKLKAIARAYSSTFKVRRVTANLIQEN